MKQRPNFELMHVALDHIRAHPELHDQGMFRYVQDCGTTMCFAGWVCELRGGTWLGATDLLEPDSTDRIDDLVHTSDYVVRATYSHRGLPDDQVAVHADDRARRLLNVDDETAEKLFYLAKDLDQLERTVKDLENEYAES